MLHVRRVHPPILSETLMVLLVLVPLRRVLVEQPSTTDSCAKDPDLARLCFCFWKRVSESSHVSAPW